MKIVGMVLCLMLVLGGCAAKPAPAPQAGQTAPLALAAEPAQPGEARYGVTVTDAAGSPVAKVMLNVCDAASCRVLTTDAAGYVAFTGEPYAYKVQVLLAPEGFKTGGEILCEPSGGEFALILDGK